MNAKIRCFLVFILTLHFQIGIAQQKTVTGKVTDENQVALPGVNITVEGSSTGTNTNFDGEFSIDVSTGDVLHFSSVGFEDQSVTVGDDTVIDLVMKEGTALDEVVVVGYGIQRKSEVTGAISSIKAEDMEDIISSSFEAKLAGRSSGVQVTPTGVIGEAPKVNIRGVASINSGTGPLYIVDGVEYNSSDNSSANMDVNPLADLNPNDIESFEILKDGAASAIYGSRAANGVILITTKRGKKNSFNVRYSSITGSGSPLKTHSLLNAKDFVMISNEKTSNDGVSDWAAGTEYDTDWQKEVLRSSALQIDQNISVSGGGDKGTYYLSLGYGEQEGTSIANEQKKYNISASVDQEFTSWLKAGATVSASRTGLTAMNKGTSALSGHLSNATKQLPNVPVYDDNNETGYNISSNGAEIGRWDNNRSVAGNYTNIMYVLKHNYYNSKRDRNRINAFAEANILDGLTYRLQAGFDHSNTGEVMYWNPIHGDGSGYNGIITQYAFEDELWNVQNILSYNKTFNNVHNLGATAVAEFQEKKWSYFEAEGQDMASSNFNKQIISNVFGEQFIYGNRTEEGIKSFIGRLTYNYDSRYFLQASIRRDGLSKLSKENRWENFFGASLGWTVSNEEFWSPIKDVVNDFKIRGSYAETGNTNIGSYPYLGTYSVNKYGNNTGIGYDQFGNDALLWETTKKLNFGLDLGFNNNRIRFAADYFINKTNDMVINSQTAPSLGIPDNFIKINAGDMENTGLELNLSATIVDKGDFTWNTDLNATFSKNKVTNLPNGEDIIPSYSSNTYMNMNIIREGEGVNSLYGWKYWGVNKENGAPVYYKADGSLVQMDYENGRYVVFNESNPGDVSEASSLSESDKQVLGQTTPKYFGGWNNTFTYKGFDLNFLFRFSGGNKIYNYTRHELMTQEFNNNSTEILGRWQSTSNPGDGWTPKLTTSDGISNEDFTSRFVEKGDFISLDNVTLGYNFTKDLLQSETINSLRVYLSAQNLFLITDYKGLDPELITSYGVDGYASPRNRIFALGINLSLF